MRGLDVLQEHLDILADDDPTCRDAWCGYWERNQGIYYLHEAHPPGVDPHLYCSPDCLDVNGGPCDTDGGGPCSDVLVFDGKGVPDGT